MANKSNEPKLANGDDFVRRVRKEAAKRQLERAAKRNEKTQEAKLEETASSRKQI